MSQLFAQTQESAFATIIARVKLADTLHITRSIDMFEENAMREDLMFAEMAQDAITAASEDGVEETNSLMLVRLSMPRCTRQKGGAPATGRLLVCLPIL